MNDPAFSESYYSVLISTACILKIIIAVMIIFNILYVDLFDNFFV